MNIINSVMDIVCDNIGIEKSLLWTSNREECVDARAVVCTILNEVGMSDKEISSVVHITRQGVNKLRNGFYYRRKQKWRVREAYRVSRIMVSKILPREHK